MAVNRSGNLFLADLTNNLVMRIGPDGIVRVVAGNGVQGLSGDGGPALNAALGLPTGLAIDGSGAFYFSESANSRVRKVAVDGTITTVAGVGVRGAAEGFEGDGGPATSALLSRPIGLVVDSRGNLYIADTSNNRVRRVDTDGIITTVAGNGAAGFGGDGGPATRASLRSPGGVAIDPQGNLVVVDSLNHRIRRIASDGTISTIAGTGVSGFLGDGEPATQARLSNPRNVVFDGSGAMYITDLGNERVRKVSPEGIISTYAGTGVSDYAGDGGPAVRAALSLPGGLAIDSTGAVYVGDTNSRRIRVISPGGTIDTFAGNGNARFYGDGGPAIQSPLNNPFDVALDGSGNLYITDSENARVRRVDSKGVISTFAGTGRRGLTLEETPAARADITSPQGVATDAAGNVYFTDGTWSTLHVVQRDGVMITLAGQGFSGYGGDGGQSTRAVLNGPLGVAVLQSPFSVFIADSGNHRIRKIDPLTGIITTYAGSGTAGYTGDGGPAAAARLRSPSFVTTDAGGNLYIADTGNRVVRKVTPDGMISTYAGNGRAGFLNAGDGGPATDAAFGLVGGLAVDKAGNLFIADNFWDLIRVVEKDGKISTVAGLNANGFSGDGGLAANAGLFGPTGLAVDSAGNLYFADQENSRIRAILSAPASFTAAPAQLSLTARSGGPEVFADAVALSASITGLPFTVRAATESGAAWLRASPGAGTMPAVAQISADPFALGPGTHRSSVSITAPGSDPPQRSVAVTLVVGPAEPPQLTLSPNGLSFSFLRGASAVTRQLRVSNAGSGSVSYTAAASAGGGSPWLSISSAGGTLTPSQPATLFVTAAPGDLGAGTYSGAVSITSAATGQRLSLPVTMTVNALPQKLVLSQTGLSFTSVVGGGVVPPLSFSILNGGDGAMSWTAEVSTLSGAAGWLAISSRSGSSTSDEPAPPQQVTVSPAGLPAGDYYGRILVTAPSASNSPQVVSVNLKVLPLGSSPPPLALVSELVFTATEGGADPGSRDTLVYNLGALPVAFSSLKTGTNAAGWLTYLPTDGTLSPDRPARLVVQPQIAGLKPGVWRAEIRLRFPDDSFQSIRVLLVIRPAGGSAAEKSRAAGADCAATGLLPAFALPSSNFSLPVSWPSTVRVEVVDDCAVPLLNGSVTVSFDNGDPAISLVREAAGRFAGTWQAGGRTGRSTLTATAQTGDRALVGTTQATGGLQRNTPVPVLNPGGITLAAGAVARSPVSPGSMISINGANLAGGAQKASQYPLLTNTQGSAVLLAGRLLPLVEVSPAQIRAQVPFTIPVNAELPLLVQSGAAYTGVESVVVAAAYPGIFMRPEVSATQGDIRGVNATGVETLADSRTPVRPGDTVVIYCTGLGEVDPQIDAGIETPDTPSHAAKGAVAVSIGGKTASVSQASLAAHQAGVYRVTAVVPLDVTPAEDVPVVLTASGQSSVAATIAVRAR